MKKQKQRSRKPQQSKRESNVQQRVAAMNKLAEHGRFTEGLITHTPVSSRGYSTQRVQQGRATNKPSGPAPVRGLVLPRHVAK